MKKSRRICMAVMGAFIMASGCKKGVDNPPEDGAHNAITTFTIKFSEAGAPAYEAIFEDADGPGGAPPLRFDEIVLQAGKTYQASITLTNKMVSPYEDMTVEVRDAGSEHQFFFLPKTSTTLNIAYNDTDKNGLPVGLETVWQTPVTGLNDTIKINLRHIPYGKTAGNPPSVGSSDLNIDFPLKIQ